MFLVWVLRIQDCSRASGPSTTRVLPPTASLSHPPPHDVTAKSPTGVIASFGLRR